MLVLNRLWQAVNIIGARRAFALLARGHAQVVHQTEDNFRTFSLNGLGRFLDLQPNARRVGGGPHGQSRHPAAARHPADFLRQAAVQGAQTPRATTSSSATNDRCQYCGPPQFLPRATEPRPRHPAPLRRQDHVGEHRVLLHQVQYPQGEPAAARGPHAAGPQAGPPKWRPVISLVLGNHGHEKWKDFLDLAYWNVELEE